jgi:hypothetical protein
LMAAAAARGVGRGAEAGEALDDSAGLGSSLARDGGDGRAAREEMAFLLLGVVGTGVRGDCARIARVAMPLLELGVAFFGVATGVAPGVAFGVSSSSSELRSAAKRDNAGCASTSSAPTTAPGPVEPDRTRLSGARFGGVRPFGTLGPDRSLLGATRSQRSLPPGAPSSVEVVVPSEPPLTLRWPRIRPPWSASPRQPPPPPLLGTPRGAGLRWLLPKAREVSHQEPSA